MSILFIEGWDLYPAGAINAKNYDYFLVDTWSTGRYGGISTNCTSNGAGFQKSFASPLSSVIVGAAHRFAFRPSSIFTFMDGRVDTDGIRQIDVRINSLFQIQVVRNNTTILATYDANILPTVWYYFEAKVNIHSVYGSVEVRLNGVPVIVLTGVNTQTSTNAYTTGIAFASLPVLTGIVPLMAFDDIYISDPSTGSDFLGECKVVTPAIAAAVSTEFTPIGAAANLLCVNTWNDDTTYVQSNTHSNTDFYTFTAISGAKNFAVTLDYVSRIDTSGIRISEGIFQLGGTNFYSASNQESTTFTPHRSILNFPANTSASTVNSLQYGFIDIG